MKKYVIILFLILGNSLAAQVEFETKISKQSLGMNETLRVDFVMNADGDNFSPPTFEGFKVVGGPSQQVSQSWINGKSSFNKTYSYFLAPTQKGNLTIKQASIEINGQVYRTNPVNVSVSAAIEKPRDPNDPSINLDQSIFLVAEVSKTNPYVNEPITVVYKLYFSFNIGISNWRELDKPKYNDFWSQNIDIKKLVAEEAKYNNEPFRYVVLRKTVLYPQKSGKLEIEPLTLDIDVQVPTGRRNLWGQMQIGEDHKKVSAGAKSINVKPLPDGKPDNFSGAVGQFDFKVKPSKTTLKNGESLNLEVKVSGTGNLKLFDIPKPIVPTGLEVYDPVRKEQVNTPLSGMNGVVADNYTIVPEFKGNYPVKPMDFTYFDLASASYKTISSPEIIIRVLDGPAAESVATQGNTDPKKEVVISDNFKFIKLKTHLRNKGAESDFLGSAAFYALAILPFALIPLLILFKRKKDERDSDIIGNRTRKSNRLAKKYLSDAKKHLNNSVEFYVALEKALHNFLKAKLHIETSEMSKEKIENILLQRNANPEIVTEFIQLTENCEFARYAPSAARAMEQDYTKAITIISELEKQL